MFDTYLNKMQKKEYGIFVAFVVVAFVAGFGVILGFITFAVTGLRILLPMFAGPTYLFFILVGSVLGYIVNRRQCYRLPHGYGFCPRFGPRVGRLLTLAAAYTKGTVSWATSGIL